MKWKHPRSIREVFAAFALRELGCVYNAREVAYALTKTSDGDLWHHMQTRSHNHGHRITIALTELYAKAGGAA